MENQSDKSPGINPNDSENWSYKFPKQRKEPEIYITIEVSSRKSEETSRTDHPERKFNGIRHSQSQPTTRTGRTGFRKVKSIKAIQMKLDRIKLKKEDNPKRRNHQLKQNLDQV